MKPIRTGIALSLTLMVFYSLCTLIWVIWPDRFLGFMSALFHGLDFRRLLVAELYAWSSFLFSLIVFGIWGFAIGVFFAWLHDFLSKP